jgi:hypothetical protein
MLLKNWYAKLGRKVPDSWEKTAFLLRGSLPHLLDPWDAAPLYSIVTTRIPAGTIQYS